jgi:predicted phage baseplate assembly protein
VTAEDFENLARETPGARIKRAKALPLRHPELAPARPAGAGQPATPIPVSGVVTVVVVPDSRHPHPSPREETLDLVARHLNRHRLVTTEIYVVPPRYRKVEVEARVIARPDADSGLVQKTLEARLLAYFHPLTGGDAGEGWPFGRTVFFSETYRQILTTDGVLRVETDSFATFVDGVSRGSEDVPLHPDELVWSDGHRVEVRYE